MDQQKQKEKKSVQASTKVAQTNSCDRIFNFAICENLTTWSCVNYTNKNLETFNSFNCKIKCAEKLIFV